MNIDDELDILDDCDSQQTALDISDLSTDLTSSIMTHIQTLRNSRSLPICAQALRDRINRAKAEMTHEVLKHERRLQNGIEYVDAFLDIVAKTLGELQSTITSGGANIDMSRYITTQIDMIKGMIMDLSTLSVDLGVAKQGARLVETMEEIGYNVELLANNISKASEAKHDIKENIPTETVSCEYNFSMNKNQSRDPLMEDITQNAGDFAALDIIKQPCLKICRVTDGHRTIPYAHEQQATTLVGTRNRRTVISRSLKYMFIGLAFTVFLIILYLVVLWTVPGGSLPTACDAILNSLPQFKKRCHVTGDEKLLMNSFAFLFSSNMDFRHVGIPPY